MVRITRQQYRELEEAYGIDKQEFVEKLEEYTGITRTAYTAHDYWDCHGNYIGNSHEFDLGEILGKAYVEVTEDGK